jgi:transcriptional regulator with XRE-family HTH domain
VQQCLTLGYRASAKFFDGKLFERSMTMPRRKSRDQQLRRLIAKLRAKGWTFQAIGDRLGVSRQAVHSMLHYVSGKKRGISNYRPPDFHCACCSRTIPRRGKWLHKMPVLCPICIDKYPATFGERLRSLRVAAGLTTEALGRQATLSGACICRVESQPYRPSSGTVNKLVAVLGNGLRD